MKALINRLGNTGFVLFMWVALTLISLFLLIYSQYTANYFMDFMLSFLLFFGSMAYGFFYFQAFPSHRLPPNYYQKKSLETEFLYNLLGVELFRRFLITSPFRRLNQRVYLKGRKEYIAVFFEETKRSETSHLIGLTIGISFLLYFIVQQNKIQCYLAFFFNTLMNVYPILLQRFNRNLRIKIRS